jgi:hypothetical protein
MGIVAAASVSTARADVPVLIGGQAANPAEWPASVYASMSGSRCSATVVGPRTLIIAAHCVGNGGTASFSVGANRYSSRCTHHPEYRRNSTADWAMCLINAPVPNVPYERLLLDAGVVQNGMNVRLTGYGCVRPGGGGGNDGIFRIGTARVTRLPSGSNYDTVTAGGAALCFGDSGGAAYVLEANGQRRIFGINSRGDIRTTSYLSSTYTASFRNFVSSWAQSNGQRICGVHADATGCRGGDSNPPPNEFVVETAIASVSARLKPGFERLFTEARNAIEDALRSLE